MKFWLKYLKNKWIVSSVFVLVYILILHDTDIFSLANRMEKRAELELQIDQRKKDIEQLKEDLANLDDPRELERYAREYHLFKKADEDLFIYSFK